MSSEKTVTGHDAITLARESRHTLVEDIFAISIGVILVSFGVFLFKLAGIVLGGVAGISLIVSYATGLKFGLLFFVINLPFFFFGIGGMGLRYIIKTFCAVLGMSLLVPFFPNYIEIGHVHPALAAVAGGTMIGLGLLALFRHGAGLGGVNILVYWLQNNKGLRAGYVQLAIDFLILGAAAFVVTGEQLFWSVIGALVFNMILGVNHKPGRYMGAS
ncbi:YitT family protein [Ahrensia marina]|uniref:Membrane protein n=1 Tax=Ahrensia marina TaxID=1514904 RepID=A0A0N0VMG1_9HYPH|nr:YitT family protein [Ahrensia marina]KPB02304.1 membrane protein [Ahrensia marina]